MQVRIVMEITGEDGGLIAREVVADLKKITNGAEDLALSLSEGKTLLARLQQSVSVSGLPDLRADFSPSPFSFSTLH